MRHLLIAVTVVFSFFSSFADRTEDSLRSIINSDSNDSLKIIAYTSLAHKCITEPTKALEVLKEMERCATRN
ncbi:MAG: hypothetical protein IPJ60_04130 [Sphingobacteriaceae bacterium]|nr:hypothetical protein [Sphingobacteriaceae bacterium]